MSKKVLSILSAILLLGMISALVWQQLERAPLGVSAQNTTDSLSVAAQSFQNPDGGMAQFAYSMQQSTSPSATLQALAEWNSYISSRSQWSMSSTLCTRLATADWNARQSGSPTISPEQLAAAATNLINNKLATLTAQEQREGFRRMMAEVTPEGALGLNNIVPYITGTEQPDGRWVVSVSPSGFTTRKTEFAQLAPGSVTNSTNFYPGEAMVIFYSLASGDYGFGLERETISKNLLANLTGLDMSTRNLYGEHGYLFRRPLNTFLTEQAMSQVFSEVGF